MSVTQLEKSTPCLSPPLTLVNGTSLQPASIASANRRQELNALRAKAIAIGAAKPEHYLFPSQRSRKVDPTKPAKGWRSAWRSIRHKAAHDDEGELIYPNLENVRFHDMRHCAVTVMAEAGLPAAVIMAQVGHIDPAMMRHYSHIRRQALNSAAAALEPTFFKPSQPTTGAELVN